MSSDKHVKGGGWIVFLGIAGVIYVGGLIFNPDNHQPPAPPAPPDYSVESFSYSKIFVKRRLKAPASACFASINDDDVAIQKLGGDTFLVQSYVDAENSFGAKLRTHYVCKLQKVGDDWKLLELKTD